MSSKQTRLKVSSPRPLLLRNCPRLQREGGRQKNITKRGKTQVAKKMSSKQTRSEVSSPRPLLLRNCPRLQSFLKHNQKWPKTKGHRNKQRTKVSSQRPLLLKKRPRLRIFLDNEKGHKAKSKVDPPRPLLLRKNLRREGTNKHGIEKEEEKNGIEKQRKQTRSEEPWGETSYKWLRSIA